jgi:hypothetical protein
MIMKENETKLQVANDVYPWYKKNIENIIKVGDDLWEFIDLKLQI